MFAINDLVVYPAQGVGQIESIDQQNIGGNACQLYTVRVRANNITLMVPVATAGHVGLRTLITKNEAQRLWKSLLTDTNKTVFAGQNWNRRFREYSERLKNPDLAVVVEVLRELLLIGRSKELSFGERRLQDQALGLVLGELSKYNLPIKAVRKDATCCGDLAIDNPKTYTLTVHMRDQVFTIPAKENETLLVAMERAGLNAPNKCRAGGCGYCHSKWLNGEFKIADGRDGRREADRKFGFIHPCVTYPLSDLEIDVPVAY